MEDKMFQIFDTKENIQLTVIMYKNEPYFLPSEIGNALGYENLSHSIRTSDGFIENIDYRVFSGTELNDLKNLSLNRNTNSTLFDKFASSITLITESGFNAVILKSTKPNAIPIRIWVTSEVMPALRKHGVFAVIPQPKGWVELIGEDMFVTTLKIAEVFNKEHFHIVRDFNEAIKEIETIQKEIPSNLRTSPEANKIGTGVYPKLDASPKPCNISICDTNEKPSFVDFKMVSYNYVDSLNRIQVAYKINRPLFNYVVLNYTGEKANFYRYMFIQQFEAMDRYIKVQLVKQEIYKEQNIQSVYIIKNELTGLLKIGVAKDVPDRLRTLSNQSGCPLQLVYATNKCKNAYEIEQCLHKMFKKHRKCGEWFSVSENIAVDILKSQNFNYGGGFVH